jgi:hypothetical protein
MLYDARGVALDDMTPPPAEPGERPSERLAQAMARLTERGAKASKTSQDTVRVMTDDLHTLCSAVYVLMKLQMRTEDGVPLAPPMAG